MSVTRTGGFAIGFRRMGSAWQKDLSKLIQWARETGFGAMDLGNDGDKTAEVVAKAGLRIGSVDLAEWGGMISSDKAKPARRRHAENSSGSTRTEMRKKSSRLSVEVILSEGGCNCQPLVVESCKRRLNSAPFQPRSAFWDPVQDRQTAEELFDGSDLSRQNMTFDA